MRKWAGCVLLAASLLAALSGWSAIGEGETAVDVIEDMKTLERLADGVISEQRRLWVITLNADGVTQRWSGRRTADAMRWVEETAERSRAVAGYVNVQGTLAEDLGLPRVWQHIEAAARAERVDAYEDRTTFSYSYLSEDVVEQAASGKSVINLQAAAHFDTESESWRITLGTPAILIEY